MSGADLSGVILSYINLSGANLSRADLQDADLHGSDLNDDRISNTIFGNNDLSQTKGLKNVVHHGSSTIGLDTIYKSGGQIPRKFLHGCGVPDRFIPYNNNSIVIPFGFPEEIRPACEQYLLYFAQFLKDMGIEATADVRHEANRVLFAVTPSEGKEALELIRQLLDIYLNLPSAAGNGTSMVLAGSIEVQRMAANIQHLNGQLLLGQALLRTQIAELEAKDATIEAKEATIS